MDKVVAVQATYGVVIGIITSLRAFMLLMNGYLRMHRRRGRFNRQSYDLRFNITRQLEHVRYLTNLSDVTCRDHLRMNIDCFNRLCFLLENVGGLSLTRNVTIAEQVAMFLSVLSHHTKNQIVKHSFKCSGYTVSKHFNSILNTLLKLHTILLVNPQHVPDDCNDNRWKYFKSNLLTHGQVGETIWPCKCMQKMLEIIMDGKKADKGSSHMRVWTYDEEKVLVNSLKELVARGYKCDNGFRSGYVTVLEQMMLQAFPNTDLRGDPHIN
ncbi:hypothetical protein ACS0TY_025885 [Phlomoides rotata]